MHMPLHSKAVFSISTIDWKPDIITAKPVYEATKLPY
jgi:hypothetical protein